jgi:hypothetical protein
MRKYTEVLDVLQERGLEFDSDEIGFRLDNVRRMLSLCDFAWANIRALAFGSFITVMATVADRGKGRSVLKELLLLCIDTDEKIRATIRTAVTEGVYRASVPDKDLTGFASGVKDITWGMGRLGTEVIKDLLLTVPWAWLNMHQYLAVTVGGCRLLGEAQAKDVTVRILDIHEENVNELSELLDTKALSEGPSLDMATKWAAQVQEWMDSGGYQPELFRDEEECLVDRVTSRFGGPWLLSTEKGVDGRFRIK